MEESIEICDSPAPALDGKRVGFLGRLEGVNRREAHGIVRQHGGLPAASLDSHIDVLVVAASQSPWDVEELLSQRTQHACDASTPPFLEVLTETQFWQRLGLVEQEQHVRRLYTPAMLAELLQVPVAVIRRWHRRGLIVPIREVHRLPYFDFQEVATARRLAQMVAAGIPPAQIESKLAQLTCFVPDYDRPLAQLSVIIEGRDLLLRQGHGLIDAGGQKRFDFAAADVENQSPCAETAATTATQSLPTTISFPPQLADAVAFPPTRQDGARNLQDELLIEIEMLEDDGRYDQAVEARRVLLVMNGPTAEGHFALAELLYRAGDLTAARERYYAAIELDEDYVEARANLGCVLAETGQLEYAVAAFQGTLERHGDYPDVHYHLARTLDDLGRVDEALDHWQRFLDLASESTWTEEARQRLGQS